MGGGGAAALGGAAGGAACARFRQFSTSIIESRVKLKYEKLTFPGGKKLRMHRYV